MTPATEIKGNKARDGWRDYPDPFIRVVLDLDALLARSCGMIEETIA
jgi:hypothetical protein